MKVSLNWVKEYVDIDLPTEQLIDKIGAQLGGIDEIIYLGERYKDALIVKVASCQKIADSDHLSQCFIDDGGKFQGVERNEAGLIQVVCGAPNVHEDMMAVWLPPGSVVPNTIDKDPLTLESREIRGLKSNGMLASAKELAIGDGHEGLLVVDEEAKPGDSFAKVYKLDDVIIDIENKMFTHRPDCFGILGIAREIAGITGQQFVSPPWYAETLKGEPPQGSTQLQIDNQLPELVPRFMAQVLQDIEVQPSPIQIQTLLSRVGIKPINNVVDVTNYIMYLTGQPLHAYDYDKLGTSKLGVRMSQAGEELELIGGKTIKLAEDAIVITDGSRAIGLGGVMGGAGTQVDKKTRNIVLEAATFDQNVTRRTSMRYGLFTDAATRFTKNQSPRQNLAAIAEATLYLIDTGAKADTFLDEKYHMPEPVRLDVEAGFINARLGLNLGADLMAQLLKNVEFGVDMEADKLHISVPFWRTDVSLAEDIVEEVGRLYGYDKLPAVLPKKDLSPSEIEDKLIFKSHLRALMSAAGCAEVLTYSFIPERLLKSAGQDTAEAFHIKNAVSPDLQFYRLSVLPSLLEKVRPNKKSGIEHFAMFELGKGHIKSAVDEDDLPREVETLAAVFVDPDYQGAPYFVARGTLDYLLDKLNIENCIFSADDTDERLKYWLSTFEPGRAAVVRREQQVIGFVGEPSLKLRNQLKLPGGVSMFEIFTEALMEESSQRAYKPLNRYPKTSQDICLRLSTEITFETADRFVWDTVHRLAGEPGHMYDMETLDIFQKAKEDDMYQITWRIELYNPERTLTSEEVNRIFDMLADDANKNLKAERV